MKSLRKCVRSMSLNETVTGQSYFWADGPKDLGDYEDFLPDWMLQWPILPPLTGNGTDSPHPDDYSSSRKTYAIAIMIFPALGIVGNLMSAAVLGCTPLKNLRSAAFMRALCFVDVSTLLSWLVFEGAFVIAGINNGLLCKFREFSINFGIASSTWIISLLSLERGSSVILPQFQQMCCSHKNRAYLFSFVILVSVASYIPDFFFVEGNESICYINFTRAKSSFPGYIYAVAALNQCLPAGIAILVNMRILYLLLTPRVNQDDGVPGSNGIVKERRLTVFTITLVTAMVILTLPFATYKIVYTSKQFSYETPLGIPTQERLLLIYRVLEAMFVFNQSTNFFCYFILGTRYRTEGFKLFKKLCRRNEVGPDMNGHAQH